MAEHVDPAHIGALDALRAYASLLVCIYHLSYQGALAGEGWLRRFLAHGEVGVPIFFVVTGFVIPYSMHKGHYELRRFGTFLWKRLVRLEPPYLISIAVAVAFWLAFHFHVGTPLNLTFQNFALHLGYLVGLASYLGQPVDWFIPAFWTLQFEFQFYILAALTFSMISSVSQLIRLVYFVCFLATQAALAYQQNEPAVPVLFLFADLFLLGIVLFQRKAGLIGKAEFLFLSGVAIASISLRFPSFLWYGPAISYLVLSGHVRSRVARFLGNISYSLYLYHSVVGLWLMGALFTVAKLDRVTSFFIALPCTLIFAALMYRLVESPAMRASKSIAYA